MKRFGLALLAITLAPACGDDGGGADAAPTPDAQPNTGTISLSWELTDGTDAIECSQVGGITVALTATEKDAAFGESDAFTCTSGGATSRPLSVGTYDLEIDLVAAGSRSLLDAPVQVTDVEVTKGQSTELAPITFEVSPSGGIAFTVEADASGSNCGTGQGDAAIIEMALELRDGDNACVPTTFDIDGMSSFTNDCGGSAALAACIESGTQVSVAATDSGPHALQIIGRRSDGAGGTVDCFTRLSPFTVPGNDLQVDLGSLQLARDPDEPLCADN